MDQCVGPACHGGDGRCGACCTKIENFGVAYGKTVVLESVNLHIHCGELTAIIGPNGGGKSTLLKAILGEIKHSGSMKFLSCDMKKRKDPVLGYVPQQLDFDKGLPVSVIDFMTAACSMNPVWLFKKSKKQYELLQSLATVSGEHLAKRRLGELSGGELQRVMLALALMPVPDVLLMDEPFSGADRKGTELFYEILSNLKNKLDMSIILVSHDFDLVKLHADRVVLLDKSIKSVGTPFEVFSGIAAKEVFGDLAAFTCDVI